jgi:hypothetical protein
MHFLTVLVALWAFCAGAVPLHEPRAVQDVYAKDGSELQELPTKHFSKRLSIIVHPFDICLAPSRF